MCADSAVALHFALTNTLNEPRDLIQPENSTRTFRITKCYISVVVVEGVKSGG